MKLQQIAPFDVLDLAFDFVRKAIPLGGELLFRLKLEVLRSTAAHRRTLGVRRLRDECREVADWSESRPVTSSGGRHQSAEEVGPVSWRLGRRSHADSARWSGLDEEADPFLTGTIRSTTVAQ